MSSSAMAGTGTGGGLVGMLGGRVAGEEKVNKKTQHMDNDCVTVELREKGSFQRRARGSCLALDAILMRKRRPKECSDLVDITASHNNVDRLRKPFL